MKAIITFIFLVYSPILMATYKVSILIGNGSAAINGKSTILKTGLKLEAGSVVKTAKKSLVIIKHQNGIILKLNENSSLVLPKSQPDVTQLDQGSVFIQVPKQKQGQQFVLKTKSMVAGVRGTMFYVSYGKKDTANDNWLCVNEGIVDVTSLTNEETKPVKAGEGVSVRQGKGVSNPKPLPWTKNLNWSFTGKDLVNKVDISEAYQDLLDNDYD